MSLWRFSVSIYHQPGVVVSSDDIDAVDRTIVEWRLQVVKTLRELRRLLKGHAALSGWPDGQTAELLCTQIKSAELESEKIEIDMLQQWLEARLPERSRGARDAAVIANLHLVLAHYGAGHRAEVSRHLIDQALSL